MLKKFLVFNFRCLVYRKKLINDENFPIYGTVHNDSLGG